MTSTTAALTVMDQHFYRGTVSQTTITKRYYLRPRGDGYKRREKDTTANYKFDSLVAWNAEHSQPPLPAPTSMI